MYLSEAETEFIMEAGGLSDEDNRGKWLE